MKKSPSNCIVHYIKFCIILIFYLLTFEQGSAQDLFGYADNYLALPFSTSGESVSQRSRFRFNITKEVDSQALFYSDTDVRLYLGQRYDSIPVIMRQAYIDLYFQSVDIRIGKQIQRFGRTFSSSLSNLMLQLTADDFVTNAPDELLSGFWGGSVTYYGSAFSVQGIMSPVWSRPQIPQPGNRWFFGIPVDLPVPAVFSLSDSLRNSASLNAAIRLRFNPSSSFDLDIIGFHWFVNQPSYSKSFVFDLLNSRFLLEESYRQSFGAAVSAEWRLHDQHRLKADITYWNSRYVDWLPQRIRDVNFENPTLPQLFRLLQVLQEENALSMGFVRIRPWIQSVLGYSWELSGWQLNHEVLLDAILNYSSDIQQVPFFYTTTHSVIKPFAEKYTWISSIVYQPVGGDAYVLNQLSYSYNDAIQVESSAHLFLGKSPQLYYPYLSFAAFSSSNFYALRIKYLF